MIERSIHEENIIVYICTPTNRAPKYIGKIDNLTVVPGDNNNPLSIIDKTTT